MLFFKGCPGRGGNLGSIGFSVNFLSQYQRLCPLGYCATIKCYYSFINHCDCYDVPDELLLYVNILNLDTLVKFKVEYVFPKFLDLNHQSSLEQKPTNDPYHQNDQLRLREWR